MAQVTKRGDKWQAEVRLKGNRKSKHFDTKRAAAGPNMILQEQKGALGAWMPITDPGRLFNTYACIIELMGLREAEQYFSDPQGQQGQPQGVPPQIVQQEVQKAYEAGKQDMEHQLKIAEMQSDERMHAQEMQIKQQEVALDGAELQVRKEESRAQAMGLRV